MLQSFRSIIFGEKIDKEGSDSKKQVFKGENGTHQTGKSYL